MADNLVIVESPAKAKTIKKYLGRDFEVLASYGHVRDLVPKEGAVDPDDGFRMKYQLLDKNERHVEAIARALRKAKALYLATDPDREGEAIAWHLKEILEARGDLEGKDVHRVVFYEITRNAIRAAVGQFTFTNETAAREVERAIRAAADAAGGELRVLAIDRKQRRRNPAPPFTTSTLQQEAARKLGFNARRTMRLAQQLYEGQDLGEGSVGLITYMRTDSVSLAAEAVGEIRAVAARLYGQQEVAEEPRIYQTKSKNAHEAHEAIRPTSAAITPAEVEGKD